MSKHALKKIVDEANWWHNITGKGTFLDINNLTQEDADRLFQKIDCGLSPENLSCDGELSSEQMQIRYDALMLAADELVKMGFTIPNNVYELG